jgi:hypothetical protein
MVLISAFGLSSHNVDTKWERITLVDFTRKSWTMLAMMNGGGFHNELKDDILASMGRDRTNSSGHMKIL